MICLIFSGLLLALVSAVPSLVGNITIRSIGSLNSCSYNGVCRQHVALSVSLLRRDLDTGNLRAYEFMFIRPIH